MKIKTKNAFTLVELLAVIVILAIILVIAVPKVMSVIEDSKKATLESTAKMIASAAEKQKVQNTVLGKTDAITCDSVAKINKGDYASCSVSFDNNTAKVTIEGSGKFDGLFVCDGTKKDATATSEGCVFVCNGYIAEKYIATVEQPYRVKDYDSCMNYTKEGADIVIDYNTEERLQELCNEKGYTLVDLVKYVINGEFYTEEDLTTNSVVGEIIKDDEGEITNVTIGNVDSCTNYMNDFWIGELGYEESELSKVCNGEESQVGYTFNSYIEDLINVGYTKEDLVQNNVIKGTLSTSNICMPSLGGEGITYISTLYNDKEVRNYVGLLKDDTDDENIRYIGMNPSNKVYFNCSDSDSKSIIYGDEGYDYDNSCEIWRMIGVFNVKTNANDTDEQKQKRIKIIREESLGVMYNEKYDGNFIEKWIDTDLYAYLNGTTEEGYYYGLSSISKIQIENAVWNTGNSEQYEVNYGSFKELYNNEKETEEEAVVGLPNSSDYYYFNEKLSYLPYSHIASKIYWRRYEPENIYEENVHPVVYLKHNVKIIDGNGDTKPYILAM